MQVLNLCLSLSYAKFVFKWHGTKKTYSVYWKPSRTSMLELSECNKCFFTILPFMTTLCIESGDTDSCKCFK